MHKQLCSVCGGEKINHSNCDRCDHSSCHCKKDHDNVADHCFCRLDDCICRDFVCDDRFKLRLGGLTTNLNFRLSQLVGCFVKLHVDSESGSNTILAEICRVGSNFVEVNVVERSDSHLQNGEPNELEEMRMEVALLEEEIEIMIEEMEEMNVNDNDELDEIKVAIREAELELEELQTEIALLDGTLYPYKNKLKRRKRHVPHRRNRRKKRHFHKSAIFPLNSIKWFELKGKCHC
ncbi:hypothetical protein ACLIBH_07890 [Virgibacillus sp. W0430]|uniref:hypothetical protein n=1 Tax=Virgibacillus sp. W0430 TaxID=3391580 RepID=UPI003F450B17